MKRRGKVVSKQKKLPDLLSSFLLLAYGFVTWLTPNMDTFDSNGPKFMTFAILNFVVLGILFWNIRKDKGSDFLFRFFDTKVGLAYAILILFTLLSFFKAINVNESILHFSKVFTTFAAAWFISVLVSRDKNVLVSLAVGLSVLLVLDSYQTFLGISKFIDGDLKSIGFIKGSYSNKNILTSAIFVKLPFALWLFYFQKGWMKYLGILSLLLGILATFFMSSRAFYLGLIVMSLLLVVYAILKFRKTKETQLYKNLAIYFVLVGLFFGAFSFVQSSLYPEDWKESRSFKARMETVSVAVKQGNLRLNAWKQSLGIIKKDPILGVGVGNWKLRILEYENKYSPTYTYMYKNHNDFLETTAESGIVAGLAFVAIFIFILWYFAVALVKKPDSEHEKYFFLPALGVTAYFFDAFFNFPQDRPEIQSWFALYVGIAAGLALWFWKGESPLMRYRSKGRKLIQTIIGVLTVFILLSNVYILVLNKKSLVLQRDIKEEIKSGKLKSSSARFLAGFPSIPDITILAEPIAVQKARYLINEKKYEQARQLLMHDKSNPFDGRKEYFIALSFYNQKQYDSALLYAEKTISIKPYFYNVNTIAASIYEKRGEFDKSITLWRNYLKGVKNKSQAWTVPVGLLERENKIKEAEQLIDSAYVYLPEDKNVRSTRARIKQKTVVAPYMSIYKEAAKLYTGRQYVKALPLLNDFIKKTQEFPKAYELRAVCLFNLKQFKKAIDDITRQEQLVGKLPSNIINIRGASYYNIGDKEKAKADFKEAMAMGDKDGANNYNRLFKKEDKPISFQVPTKK